MFHVEHSHSADPSTKGTISNQMLSNQMFHVEHLRQQRTHSTLRW